MAGLTLMLQLWLAVLPAESLTATLNRSLEPALTGTPVTLPVMGFRLNPAGRLPDGTDTVYGGSPPCTFNVELNHAPACIPPLGQLMLKLGRFGTNDCW